MSRLDELNIRLMVQGPAVSIYARENCIAAVGGGGSGQGSTGMMTELGLAYLVWREGRPYLAAKGSEIPATAGAGGSDPQILTRSQRRLDRRF